MQPARRDGHEVKVARTPADQRQRRGDGDARIVSRDGERGAIGHMAHQGIEICGHGAIHVVLPSAPVDRVDGHHQQEAKVRQFRAEGNMAQPPDCPVESA